MNLGSLFFKFGAKGADDVQREANKAAKSLEKVEKKQEEVSKASKSSSRSVKGSANTLAVELTQAAQDAQFGLAGVSNQVPLIFEQFERLKRSAGGTSSAISALGKSFAGPAGIIGAATLLPTLLPKVISFFKDTKEEAKDTADAIRDAASAVTDIQSGIETRQFDAETIGPAIGRAENRVRELRNALSTLEQFGAIEGFDRLNDTQQAILQKALKQEDAVLATADFVEQRLKAEKETLGFLQDQEKSIREQQRQAQILDEIGASVQDEDSSDGDTSAIPDRPRIQAQQATNEIVSQDDQAFAGLGAQVRKTGELIDQAYTRAVIRANAVTLGFKRQGNRAIRQVGQAVGQTIGKILTLQTAVSGVGDAFKQIGKSILQVLQKVIAKLVSAVATAGILAAVSGGGFGSLFGSVLGVPGLGGGGGGGGVGAVSGAPSLEGVGVTETRLDGRDLALSVTKTQNAQRRKGRTSR